jgi:hypothetical protein
MNMKPMTQSQLAKLSLLSMSLDLPAGFHGYLALFTQPEQPQRVAADWLARIEAVAPGVTQKYWEIVNGN